MHNSQLISRHDNETRTRGYSPKLVPILTENTRVDRYGFGNYSTFLIGVGNKDATTHPIHIPVPRPDDEIIKILLIIC